MKNKIIISSLMFSLLGLGGCAQIQPMNNSEYSLRQANQAMSVQYGTVIGVKSVLIRGQDTGIGTGAGALAGGFLGSRIGGGNGSIAAAIVGAVAGGVAGNMAEKNITTTQGLQLTVRLDGSNQIILVTEKTNQYFNIGDRVQVIGLNTNDVRVSH